MTGDAHPDPGVFATTRWTLVTRARGGTPEARSALSDLCAAYYAPVAAFLRRETRDPDAARELTHEFFARLLAGSGVAGADPARGRFRSYLLGAVKHFLQVDRVRRSAAKRGAGAEHVPLEPGTDTSPGLDLPDPGAVPADAAFEREWAHALLGRALDRLGAAMAAEGKAHHFGTLKPCLLGSDPAVPYVELAVRLGLTEAAVKVAVHRLRKRFRDAVHAEIADTLADPGQVDEELQHLVAVLSGA